MKNVDASSAVVDSSSVAIRRPAWRRVQWLGWVLLVAATTWISAQAHRQAGFTLPPPWNDEPWVLWSSIALAEHGTFYSESLHPERVVPREPTYQVPLALLFKLTGFSYAKARWVSWVYLMLAYAGMLALVKSRPLPVVSAAVVSLFFLGVNAVVAGNMARQESMVWMLAVWSFVLVDRGHGWKALAVAGLAVLTHQLGLVYFGGVFLLFLLGAWEQRGYVRPSKSDLGFMAVAGAVLIGQILFMWANWGAILSDWTQAYGESFQQNVWGRLFASNQTPWLLALAVFSVVGLGGARRLRAPALLGLCAYLVPLLRPQLWYALYAAMAYLLLALLIPWALCGAVEKALKTWARPWPGLAKMALLGAVFGGGLLPMLKFSYAHGFITGPRNYPEKLGGGWGRRMADPTPYLTELDVQAIVREIEKHVADGKERRVFFMPEGDGLFFHGKLPTNAIPYQGVRTQALGDMAVFRFSRHFPAWWRDQHALKYLRMYGGEGRTPFYERDGTEAWILVPPRTGPDAGGGPSTAVRCAAP